MDITFDKILIYSKGPTIMAHFLTSLFDVEVFKVADDLYDFKLGGSPFRILKSESSDNLNVPPFQFTVGSEDDFSGIKQRLEFFNYTQKVDLKILSENGDSLEVIDPDNRIWKFILSNKSNFSREIPKNDNEKPQNLFLM